MSETTPSPLGNVITIDDERIKLDRVVRGSVEETLNALLDDEADRLCNARRYERPEARRDSPSRALRTSCRPRPARSSCAYRSFGCRPLRRRSSSDRRRESSVEEALIEMYLAGCRSVGSRTSLRRCGAREFRPRLSRTSARRSMGPSRRGAIG